MCETRGESPGAEGRGYRSTVLRESEGRGPNGSVMEEPRAGLGSRSLPSAGDSLADIFWPLPGLEEAEGKAMELLLVMLPGLGTGLQERGFTGGA